MAGRGQDAGALGLVVEADIAAHDREVERAAGVGHPGDGGGELAHDLGLLGIAEVHVVGDGERPGAHGTEVAPGFGDGLLTAFLRVGLAVARRAVGREGEGEIMALDADHGGVGSAGSPHGLAADGAVVLVPDPGARAQVGTGDHRQQGRADADRIGHVAERSPLRGGCGRAVIQRRLFGDERIERDFGFDLAVMLDDDVAGIGQVADDGEVELPLLEDGAGHVLSIRSEHHQHALLALGQHHLVGGHRGFALRAVVEVEFDPDAALAGHFYG